MNKVTAVAVTIFFVFKLMMISNDCNQVTQSNQRIAAYQQQMNQAYIR